MDVHIVAATVRYQVKYLTELERVVTLVDLGKYKKSVIAVPTAREGDMVHEVNQSR